MAGIDCAELQQAGLGSEHDQLMSVSETNDSQDEAEEQCAFAELVDFEAGREEVLRRVEEVTLWFLEILGRGEVPQLSLVARTARNSVLAANDTLASCSNSQSSGSGSSCGSQEAGSYSLRLQHATQLRSLTARQGEGAFAYVRIFKVLQVCHELLLAGKTCTQRELYYCLLSPPIITSTSHVNEAIQDVVSLLHVPRSSLGISCSSRGAVAGCLRLDDGRGGGWLDCSILDAAGKSIPGDAAAINTYSFDFTGAVAVVVVEKDAVFQRLSEDRVWGFLPLVLVTAKGMPDMATRIFLSRLASAHPSLPFYALVDWNPAGLCIALQYKYGSSRMGLESPRYALPSLRWLGARSSQLATCGYESLQPLTQRDRAMVASLSAAYEEANPDWVEELQVMQEQGCKAEIEALYGVTGATDGLARFLVHAIQTGDYLE